MMVLRFYSQVFENGVGPEALHEILQEVSERDCILDNIPIPSCQFVRA